MVSFSYYFNIFILIRFFMISSLPFTLLVMFFLFFLSFSLHFFSVSAPHLLAKIKVTNSINLSRDLGFLFSMFILNISEKIFLFLSLPHLFENFRQNCSSKSFIIFPCELPRFSSSFLLLATKAGYLLAYSLHPAELFIIVILPGTVSSPFA